MQITSTIGSRERERDARGSINSKLLDESMVVTADDEDYLVDHP